VGRNYCYQTQGSAARLFFEGKHFNPFVASGALSSGLDDFNSDAFDHSALDFVGGGNISCGTSNGRPISNRPTPPGTPRWGSAWKKATAETYQNATAVGAQGSSYPIRGNYLDLDPTYKDRHGRPLLRMTFDFPDNDLRMSRYISEQLAKIGKAMNPKQMVVSHAAKGWDSAPYQTTHNTGGATMGAKPGTSAVNRYLQSWDVSNIFVLGASAFQQNEGRNPTGTVGALAYWAAEAIRDRYLKQPGPLVPA
jgi:gluconate 2-dehydrogenase alpha chain